MSNRYACDKCGHNCQSYNGGKTYAINGGSGFIWLDPSEYTPCGVQLHTVASSHSDGFPETLTIPDYGMFSRQITEGDEVIYGGNELLTQGYEIRLADNGDFFGGFRNFVICKNDDMVSHFDENGDVINS